MRVFENLNSWLIFRANISGTLGFVPTMGALHDGHLSLVRRSRDENTNTLVSIFVNPTQFNNKDDLEKYPRTIEKDLSLLESVGVNFVLLPNEKEIYADGNQYRVLETEMSKILCGAHRPGHFEGVLTVVLKLLGLAACDRCYMGEKDYQQFLLVKQMARSFFLKTEIVPCPTSRESSGLAMSSRNERLSPAAREKAALIYKTLSESANVDVARATLAENGFDVEYLEEHWGRRLVAAWIEGVRLIDNVAVAKELS
jgi:pantoate--beta-alanine ligase